MEQVKSVFRRRKVEKLYVTKKVRKHWTDAYREEIMEIRNDNRVISDDEIGRYDIDFPQLEAGNKFFLHDKNEIIVIQSKMRSSDNTVVYYAEDELVETEETKRTHRECTEKVEQWDERYNRLKRNFEEYMWKHPCWLKLFWRK